MFIECGNNMDERQEMATATAQDKGHTFNDRWHLQNGEWLRVCSNCRHELYADSRYFYGSASTKPCSNK